MESIQTRLEVKLNLVLENQLWDDLNNKLSDVLGNELWYLLDSEIRSELYFELAELWNVIHENDNK